MKIKKIVAIIAIIAMCLPHTSLESAQAQPQSLTEWLNKNPYSQQIPKNNQKFDQFLMKQSNNKIKLFYKDYPETALSIAAKKSDTSMNHWDLAQKIIETRQALDAGILIDRRLLLRMRGSNHVSSDHNDKRLRWILQRMSHQNILHNRQNNIVISDEEWKQLLHSAIYSSDKILFDIIKSSIAQKSYTTPYPPTLNPPPGQNLPQKEDTPILFALDLYSKADEKKKEIIGSMIAELLKTQKINLDVLTDKNVQTLEPFFDTIDVVSLIKILPLTTNNNALAPLQNKLVKKIIDKIDEKTLNSIDQTTQKTIPMLIIDTEVPTLINTILTKSPPSLLKESTLNSPDKKIDAIEYLMQKFIDILHASGDQALQAIKLQPIRSILGDPLEDIIRNEKLILKPRHFRRGKIIHENEQTKSIVNSNYISMLACSAIIDILQRSLPGNTNLSEIQKSFQAQKLSFLYDPQYLEPKEVTNRNKLKELIKKTPDVKQPDQEIYAEAKALLKKYITKNPLID